MTGQTGDVLDRSGGLDRVRIAVEVGPGEVGDVRPQISKVVRVQTALALSDWEGRKATVPRHLGGYALADFIDTGGTGKQCHVRVRVDVDETGDQREAGGIDVAAGPGRPPGVYRPP